MFVWLIVFQDEKERCAPSRSYDCYDGAMGGTPFIRRKLHVDRRISEFCQLFRSSLILKQMFLGRN